MLRWPLVFSVILAAGCGDSTATYDSMAVSAASVADSATDAFISPYRDSMGSEMAHVLVSSGSPILRGRPDSPLGSLMADLIYKEGMRLADSVQVRPDVCVLNIGGFRIDLPEGDITVAHVFELMPFENVINLVLLTEEGVAMMMEHLVKVHGQPVSGIRLRAKGGKAVSLEVGGRPYTGGPLWVITSDYLADGGDHMIFFEERIQRIETGMTIRELLIRQLGRIGEGGGELTAPADRRIIIEP